jgi:hypothetical protein
MNLTVEQIMDTCHDCGLRVEPCGDRLLVVDEVRREPYVPESLFHLLVEHRDEIRERLRVGHLAKQILYGEFDAATLAKLLKGTTQ